MVQINRKKVPSQNVCGTCFMDGYVLEHHMGDKFPSSKVSRHLRPFFAINKNYPAFYAYHNKKEGFKFHVLYKMLAN